MNQPILKTQRLILRAFTLDDSAEVQRMVGNFNVAKQTLNIPHPYLDGMAEQWIQIVSDDLQKKSKLTYAITLAQNGNLLGATGLNRTDVSEAELGYWVGEEYWGHGYCTEACKQLIQYAFNEREFSKITARHLLENTASGRVMEKAGMSFVEEAVGEDRNGDNVRFKFYEVLSS